LLDIAADLNAARPVSSGGTGASDAPTALVNLGLTATAAELNILDGVTATAAELNILDGVTATTAQINKSSTIADNASGSAPIYACRAWVNFDGTLSGTITPRASGNVSSVTKNGTGDYTVNFTTAMPDENYSAIVTTGNDSNISSALRSGNVLGANTPPSTTSVRVGNAFANSLNDRTSEDSTFIFVAIFR
jgi:hypothetical protein